MFSDLLEAVFGVVVEIPDAVIADVVTFGGALTDRDEPYTSEAVKKVVENIQESTE